MRGAGVAATAALLLVGCAPRPVPSEPADAFLARLQSLCGKAYPGRVVTDDPADAAFAGKPLVMHVRTCGPGEVRIPFHVGDDRSRTWIVARTAGGLRLKHDHRHADGSPDAMTMYGGDSIAPGSATAQAFPADAESIALFRREKREVSVSNVWEIEATPTVFVYALRRADRHFRVAFDLTTPVAPPPPPW